MATTGALHDKNTATQCDAILAWLKAGKTITPKEALDEFGCMRLGARIYDLKRQGHAISVKSKKVVTRAGTARVAEYSLAQAGKAGEV